MNPIKVIIYMTAYAVLMAILFNVSPVLGMVWAITLPLRWVIYEWIDRRYSK